MADTSSSSDDDDKNEYETNLALQELVSIMTKRFQDLVERGFLAPHFLNKMISDPSEVIKFIRQNRQVVSDTLNKRLNKKIRPTPQQLEDKGVVPKGYFDFGHDIAMKSKHRRKSSAQQDLAMMLKLRPQKEDIIKKGVIDKSQMETFYELDDTKLDDMAMDENDYYDNNDDEEENYTISILSSLLFKTISEALKKSCLDTQEQENTVLLEMVEMNNEMKSLRNILDKYFLSQNGIDTMLHENDENAVREKFHSIQEKLLHISSRQNRIHEKLRILHSVERSMISLQNNYQIRLSSLKKTEMNILNDLQTQKQRRDRAIKIMYAEKSHQSWALTKLDYTVNIAKEYNDKRQSNDYKDDDDDTLSEDINFVNELEKFLLSLRNISEHQKQIVRDFDNQIEELEAHLLSIRYDMSKVRTMTFKKIYDLHKQVQIAESLELGYRRLSVASATEIERERRHHSIKIQRQLNTLNNQIKEFNYKIYEKNLKEIVDIQIIMSHKKLKTFFAVFIQTFSQTVIDIELTYNNLNSLLPPIDGGAVNSLCDSLYGIDNVLNKIESKKTPFLNDKLTKCFKFIKKIKKAIKIQQKQQELEQQTNNDNNNKNNDDEKKYNDDDDNKYNDNNNNNSNKKKKKSQKIKTFQVNNVILIIARKLCINLKEEIEIKQDSQIARYAEMKTIDIFETILNGTKIFKKDPISQIDASRMILSKVYGISAIDESLI